MAKSDAIARERPVVAEASGPAELGQRAAQSGPRSVETEGGEEPRFTFRPLQGSDIAAVLTIERQVFKTPWNEAAFRAFLRPWPAFSVVGVAGEEVAGYALGWCVPPEAELMNLAVDPRWQGRSLGAALLHRTLATCARRGAAEIFLEVRVSNERAQRLYRRHGFRLLGRRRSYYSNPREDALVLRAFIGHASDAEAPSHGGADEAAGADPGRRLRD